MASVTGADNDADARSANCGNRGMRAALYLGELFIVLGKQVVCTGGRPLERADHRRSIVAQSRCTAPASAFGKTSLSSLVQRPLI